MGRTPTEDLRKRLTDPEYARLYGAAQAKYEFAVSFSRERRRLGWTQQDLAEALNLSQPYIAKLERGDANPTLGTIGSILAVLGLRLVTSSESLFPRFSDREAGLCGGAPSNLLVRTAGVPALGSADAEYRAGSFPDASSGGVVGGGVPEPVHA